MFFHPVRPVKVQNFGSTVTYGEWSTSGKASESHKYLYYALYVG